MKASIRLPLLPYRAAASSISSSHTTTFSHPLAHTHSHPHRCINTTTSGGSTINSSHKHPNHNNKNVSAAPYDASDINVDNAINKTKDGNSSSYNWARFLPSLLSRKVWRNKSPNVNDRLHDGIDENVNVNENHVDDRNHTASIKIDSSGLYKTHHTHLSHEDRMKYKEPATPLTDELRQRIQVRGPISIAEYMNECLTHPLYGYYSRKENILPSSSFTPSSEGAASMRGDFITNPEISQVYGELLCLWYILVWTQLGEPSRIQFIEFGPGNGTLLSDFLRTATQFPKFYKALSSGSGIHLVETSSSMRRKQRQSLGINVMDVKYAPSLTQQIHDIIPDNGDVDTNNLAKRIHEYDVRKHAKPLNACDLYGSKGDAYRKEHKIGSISDSEHASSVPIEGLIRSNVDNQEMNIQVRWYDVIDDVPHAYQESKAGTWSLKADYPTFLLAHEFFDALPIHRFEYRTENENDWSSSGWCEHLVDIDGTKENPQHFRFVLSNTPTPASKLIMHGESTSSSKSTSTSTASSNRSTSTILQRQSEIESGTRIEVSPAALQLIEDITYRVGKSGGVALVIDYGSHHSLSNSLQAVENHEYTHPLSRPGLADLTAQVDFNQLRHAAQRTINKFQLNARIETLITQHEFLRDMGIATRINALLRHIQTSDQYLLRRSDNEIAQLCDDLISAAERLVKTDQMGELFKFFAISSQKIDPVPVFSQLDRAKKHLPLIDPESVCPLRQDDRR